MITNPTKENITLGKNIQVGHLEAVNILMVEEAIDIMHRTQDAPTVGMSQATPEELNDRLKKVKDIA